MEIKVGSLFVSQKTHDGVIVPILVTRITPLIVEVYNFRMSRKFNLNRDIFLRYYSLTIGEQ